jgi:prolipoprotein diacylglyceryl transferase
MMWRKAVAENPLAWMHWDPDSVAFTVPVIDHPIKWYGILWMLGFGISYFLMVWMLSYKLGTSRRFSRKDVKDWSLFLGGLQASLQSHDLASMDDVLRHLKRDERKALEHWKHGQEPSTLLKEGTLRALNQAVSEDPEFRGERRCLEQLGLDGLITSKEHAQNLTDRLTIYVILGAIIGARLGHVIFYDLEHMLRNPIEIVMVWKGGLASHGGTVGVILALLLFWQSVKDEYQSLSLLNVMEYVALCVGLVGCFIRFGNFINQEILGKVTTVPWAVIFGHPASGTAPAPRHPVQLYESFAYLAIFLCLLKLWLSRRGSVYPGRLLGLLLFSVFSMRIVLEEFKEPMTALGANSALTMGQWLSVPFVLLGLFLMFYKKSLMEPHEFS